MIVAFLFLFLTAKSAEVNALDGEKVAIIINEKGKKSIDLKVDGKEVHLPLETDAIKEQVIDPFANDSSLQIRNQASNLVLEANPDAHNGKPVSYLFGDELKEDPSLFESWAVSKHVADFSRDLLGEIDEGQSHADMGRVYENARYIEDHVDSYLKLLYSHYDRKEVSENKLEKRKIEKLKSLYDEFFKNVRSQTETKGSDFDLLRRNLRTISDFAKRIEENGRMSNVV